MVKERTKRHLVKTYFEKTRGLCAFSLCPDISDRKAYEGLSEDLKKEILSGGERAKKAPWSQIFLSDYLEFAKNGNRERFETLYFLRREKLCSLVLAECVENSGRFIPDILDGMYLMLEESSWCLPAHNTHVRDAKQQEYPDVAAPIIDLFAAETGALIAFLEYLLRPVFEKKSPLISRYVNKSLNERIFKPYSNEHFWWMGDGVQDMCNWTPWCTQNVLLCVLTRPEGYFEEKEIRKYLESAAISLDFFLDEYGDDGCCSEGAQYYSHAGLCLFGALYLMNNVLKESEFEGVFKEELIRNIAGYIVRMNVEGNAYLNFADCAAVCPRRTSREFLFGKMCGDLDLSAFAASDFRKGSASEKLLSDEINLFYHVIQVFAYDEMESYPERKAFLKDFFFESTGLLVSRDERYILAAKAGNNADSHNHNDVGSFTVYKDGKPLIIDLGVGTYTRKTFSDERYEIWTMQSQFHNVPTFIDGDVDEKELTLGRDSVKDYHDEAIVMQKDGKEFQAAGVKCEMAAEGQLGDLGDDNSGMGKEVCSLSMDIADAYKDPGIRSYRRKISLIKGQGILVEDEYDGDKSILLTLMTYEKPEITESDGDFIKVEIGNLGIARITGAEWAKVQVFPIDDERLKLSWKHEVYRTLIKMDDGKRVKLELR
ncbi:MAG: heparinase II/III family protein [Butyrivibrio sp.]|nr:heparinase II/III family protein [Butyrivibrio sp.]